MGIILWPAIVLGMIAAGAAFYGRYWTLPAWFTGPNICKLESGGCQVLFRTKNAALLGVPNSLLGLLYYPFLAAGFSLGWPLPILFAASSFSFVLSAILAWILLRDRLECRVCWTGHACNTVIWLVLLWRLSGK
jgi:uncharacterized membrane protein